MDAYLADARERLRRLDADLDAGRIDAERYEQERRRTERGIGEHLTRSAADDRSRPSARLIAGLTASVLTVALAGYLATGSLASWFGNPNVEKTAGTSLATAAPDAAASGGTSASLQQIAAMVDGLAARMKERPDDAEGWTMLARSYAVLGRFADAEPAYAKAVALQPGNAALLADYADAAAAAAGTLDNPRSKALLERALGIDARQPKALALAGTAAYDQGDYARAIALWQQIAAQLPADSELAKPIQASIAEARQRAAAPGTDGGSAPMATAAANARAGTAGASAAAATGPAASSLGVRGVVSLDPALRGRASPRDTVFVFARSASGGRMPLAVQRATVADLPFAFKLDDRMAMAPGAAISGAAQVVVGARISKSGNAMPQAGDLSGEAAPVAPGADGVAIRIDRVVEPR